MKISRTATMGLPKNYGKARKVKVERFEVSQLIREKEDELSWELDLVQLQISNSNCSTPRDRIIYKNLLGKEKYLFNSSNRLARMKIQNDKSTRDKRNIRVTDLDFLRKGII